MLENRQIPSGEKLDEFVARPESAGTGSAPDWFNELRTSAAEAIRAEGFPHAKLESWEFSLVRKVLSDTYDGPVPAPAQDLVRERMERAPAGAVMPALVFVNGRLERGLSNLRGLPEGVEAISLSGLEPFPEVRDWIGRAASFSGADKSFRGLNLMMADDPAVILVRPGCELKEDVQLIFISAGQTGHRAIANPGVFVYAGEGASLSLIETHIGLEGGSYLANSCTMLAAGKGSVVRHIKVIEENSDSYHLSSVLAELAAGAELKTHTLIRAGGLVRNEVEADLNGEGSRAELYGLYLATAGQQVENSTCIRHNKPDCKSREHYKGILSGDARAVFRGRIVVAEDAQLTDSKQTNNNLLLSEEARINSKPQLEIYADDVSCTHGATVGQLEEEKLFYLQSRGISRVDANSLLVQAFGNEIVSKVDSERLRKGLEEALLSAVTV